MVRLEHGTLMRDLTDELLAESSVQPVIRAETSSSHHALELVATGVGAFVVDSLISPDKLGNMRLIPLISDGQSINVQI